MLAAALNSIGGIPEDTFGQKFVELFNDFKVVKLSPIEELEKGPLQLCVPVEYQELIKNIQYNWDSTQTFLEMRGLKAKLQRAIRQMFFFDEEKIFDKVLLLGCVGVNDFPWAIQVVVMQPPVSGWEQNLELIGQADILVLNDVDESEAGKLIEQVKLTRPDMPVFAEEISQGLSIEFKDSLEKIFIDHLAKRKRIKQMLREKQTGQSISCEQAYKMAAKLRVGLYLFGNVCDECGYSITRCRLGCF